MSDAVGGYPGILEKLASASGTVDVPLHLQTRATFAADAGRWAPAYSPPALPPPEKRSGVLGQEESITFSDASLSWKIDPPSKGVNFITCASVQGTAATELFFHVKGTVDALLSATLRSSIEEALWAGAKPFLSLKASR